MKKTKMIALSTLAILGSSLDSAALWAQGRNEIIVQTGQTAPDANGTFSGFNSPQLNESGQVAFSAVLSGTSGGGLDDRGIYLGSAGSITQIAREGQAAPDANGTFGDNLDFYALNNSGQALFRTGLNGTSGGGSDSRGIFLGSGGSITQIARAGQSAPDANGIFSGFHPLQLNELGQVVFSAVLNGTSGGFDDTGIFRGNGGSITQIARGGQSAPNANGTFSRFFGSALNDSGQVAFSAVLEGTSGGGSDSRAIFLHSGSSITQIARAGQSTPNGNGTFSNFDGLELNDSGQAAFFANLIGTSGGNSDNAGIFLGSGGSITQIARLGQSAPDANGTFNYFQGLGHNLNNSGQVAFWAALNGTSGGENRGLFRGDGGSIIQIARAGQSAPNANGIFSDFGNPVLNDSGQVATTASLTGTSGGNSDNYGIITGDGIDFFQVIRQGDSLAGGIVTGTILDFFGDPLNEFGQIAYQASLDNGEQVIGRWTPDLHWRTSISSTWDTAFFWTLGLKPGNPHKVFIDPSTSLTVTGPAADTTVNSLQVGGGVGLATLKLRNGVTLTSTNGVNIASTGTLTGNGSIAGDVTNDGKILAENVAVVGTLTNNGLVTGNGVVHADIINHSVGEIRASNGETLRLTGSSLTNAGRIEVIVGELEVSANLNNESTGSITGSDATMRFNGGLANAGSLGIAAGTADVYGEIANAGTINVSGGATARFHDDFAQNGIIQVARDGNNASTAVFFGALSGDGFVGGGDVYALAELRPGFSPASVLYDGNLFLGDSTETFIELGGLGFGQFDQLRVTGDLSLAGDLMVSLIDGYTLGAGQQFLIGDITGMLSGQFNGLGEGSLVGVFSGYQTFISYSAGDGNDIALYTAIPEPGTPAVFALVSLFIASRRRKQRFTVRDLRQTAK